MDVKTKEKVEVDAEYVSWVKEELRAYYDKQLANKVDAEIEVAVGFPHREILRQARAIDADLIVLGRSTGKESDSVYKKSMAGSTVQRVAKAARCPVMTVSRPAASFWGGMSNIVFGTDFSRASDSAFALAVELSRTLDCELHIFHALDVSAMLLGRMLTQDEIEQGRREALRRIRGKYVPGLAGIKNYSMEVWEGVPFIEIVKYARETHADLIVMAHHSRAVEVEESTIGSNVEQVIVRAGCPVISMNR
jgi:nucleotide-binding universal stress UspA family protein